MTPSNQPLDNEAQAIAEAFKDDSNPSEKDKGNGSGGNASASAQNSNQQQNQNSVADEGSNGSTGKTFKVQKPKVQKPDENQNQQSQQQQQSQSVIKPEDFEKHLSEMFKMDSKGIGSKLKRADELEALMEKSPYLTTQGQELDRLLAKKVSPETALKYINADKTKMSHKEIMALALHVENPEIGPDKVSDYVDQLYKLGKYAENGDEAPGLTRLEFDVQKHLKTFDDLKAKMISNEDNRTSLATKQKEVERIKGWEKPIKDIFENFTSIDVMSPAGSKLQYGIEMTAEERAEMQSEFNEMVLKNPWQATEEGIADAKAVLRARYIISHFDEMALAFMGQGRTFSDNEWINEIHNPSLPNGKGAQQHQNQNQSGKDDKIFDAFMQSEGGIKRKN